jgi:uncharacterized protein YuzE
MQTLVVSTTYDASADAAYIAFGKTLPGEAVRQIIVEDDELGNLSVVLDVDAKGKLLGIELLEVSTLLARPRFGA